jgi:hypothetical protein
VLIMPRSAYFYCKLELVSAIISHLDFLMVLEPPQEPTLDTPCHVQYAPVAVSHHVLNQVDLQVLQSSHGAPLLGQCPSQAIVVQVSAGGQGTHIGRSNNTCLAECCMS